MIRHRVLDRTCFINTTAQFNSVYYAFWKACEETYGEERLALSETYERIFNEIVAKNELINPRNINVNLVCLIRTSDDMP